MKKQYLPFKEAREFVRKHHFKNEEEFKKWYKSEIPKGIPSNPARTYKNKGWVNLGDWLGTGTIANFNKEYLPFEKAREFVRKLGLKSKTEYEKWRRSGKRPPNIPSNPNDTYKDEGWKGWGDWLGTGTIAPQNKVYRPFEKAREFVHRLKLKNEDEWRDYVKSGKKPKDIPANPYVVYKEEWRGMGDWLGTNTIATYNREYLPFNKAKIEVHSHHFKNMTQFKQWQISEKPPSIPAHPEQVYENDWKGTPDWLGYEETVWNVRTVKELLRDWIESGAIYNEKDIVLHSLLASNGLLNLRNKHTDFFKNLVEARNTTEGLKAIIDHAYSDSEEPPELEGHSISPDEDIQTASTTEELKEIVKDEKDPLDQIKVKPLEELLRDTERLDSYTADVEKMQFFVNVNIREWWSRAFLQGQEESTVQAARNEPKKDKYHNEVIETFLSDYDGANSIEAPAGYAFAKPTLMQKFVAYKVKTQKRFGNFSGVGAGKTLSAILSSRVIDSKMTVIICPKAIVDQWKESIETTFPDSVVMTTKEYDKKVFYAKRQENKHKYLVINYDKFSLPDSETLAFELGSQKIDFFILDEIHFVKRRDPDESKRLTRVKGLMSTSGAKDAYVLGLSATPVINSLEEGKSLLELITGKIYDDVSTIPHTNNAVKLYEKLSMISVRQIPQYPVKENLHEVYVDVDITKSDMRAKDLKSGLDFEQLTLPAKLPKILECINGPTIIYTEYVTEIINKITKAVRAEEYSVAEHHGQDHTGQDLFLNKQVDVLVASHPVSTGVNGLQNVCNNIIISALPWTNAQYKQLVGRLLRTGQEKDVNVHIVKANINGIEYDENKWLRILNKRALADCAVDGIMPIKNIVSPQQAVAEARKWLERLERGEISVIQRKDLDVELIPTPIEVQTRGSHYVVLGNISKFHKEFNNEYSHTTHQRLQRNPQSWEAYHKHLREVRKTWPVDPLEEIIKRINNLSPHHTIGDFGCGEDAKIAENFGSRVLSFDHLAKKPNVKACDMKNTGLPDESLDIAVFSQSLMGRNWSEYLAEAKRCLYTNGSIIIAESTKQIKERLSTLMDELIKLGFDIYKDEEKGEFTFIEARKL